MKYLTWNKTPHLLSVGTWWGSILKWILEFLTCFEKMFQLSGKSPDWESGFLGKSILKMAEYVCVSLCLSLSSIISELCISQLRTFLLIHPQCISGVGNYLQYVQCVPSLPSGRAVAGADPGPLCSNILLPLQLKSILRQFLLFPNEKEIFPFCKMQLLIRF